MIKELFKKVIGPIAREVIKEAAPIIKEVVKAEAQFYLQEAIKKAKD